MKSYTRDTLRTGISGNLFAGVKESTETIFLIAAKPVAAWVLLACSETLKSVKCLQGTHHLQDICDIVPVKLHEVTNAHHSCTFSRDITFLGKCQPSKC